jgi:hypothetical protein
MPLPGVYGEAKSETLVVPRTSRSAVILRVPRWAFNAISHTDATETNRRRSIAAASTAGASDAANLLGPPQLPLATPKYAYPGELRVNLTDQRSASTSQSGLTGAMRSSSPIA